MSLSRKKPLFHDTPLYGKVLFTHEWQEIDVRGLAIVERDRQMIGFKISDPFGVDFDNGVLTNGEKAIELEVRLIGSDGQVYPLNFEHARGTKLVGFRSEEALPGATRLEKLQFRSDDVFKAEEILWTTYSAKDMK